MIRDYAPRSDAHRRSKILLFAHAHSKKCHNLGQKSNRYSHFLYWWSVPTVGSPLLCIVFILTPSARRAHQVFQVDVQHPHLFVRNGHLDQKSNGRFPGPKRAKKTSILRFLGPGEFPEPQFLPIVKFPRMVDVHTATCFCPKWNSEIY